MVSLNNEFLRFSRRTGIHIQEDRNGQIVSITTLKKKDVPELENPATTPTGLGNQAKHTSEEEEDEDFANDSSCFGKSKVRGGDSMAVLPLDAGVLKTSNQQYLQLKSRVMTRFRYIVFLHCINDIPVRQMRTHPQETFWVEIEVLDQVLRYKIEPQFLQVQPPELDDQNREGQQELTDKKDLCRIDMNRLSVKYFFSHGRDSLRNYVQDAKV